MVSTMKKIYTLICFAILTALLMLLLTGCAKSTDYVSSKTEESSLFCIIEKCEGYYILYNKDTKVMYWSSNGPYNTGTLTLLVNADGTPQIYKGSE